MKKALLIATVAFGLSLASNAAYADRLVDGVLGAGAGAANLKT